MKTFGRDGVEVTYPANWTVETEDTDGGWSVVLQSPDTAFALVSLRPDADDPARLADEALATLRAEYPTLDADVSVAALGAQPAVGHDIDFMTLDTAAHCWTRCVDTPNGPLLVMCQTSDYDRACHEPALRAICASVRVED